MKKIFLIACLFVLKSGFSFAGDSLNILDATGKRQGPWVITNEISKLPDYAPTAKVEEGRYKDDKKIGKWKRYYPTGTVKSLITFQNNSPNGYAIIYHPNGKIMEEGLWQNQRWVGDYKLYYDNGEPQQEFKFNASGKREGPQKYYHPNGKIMIEGNWNNGNEAGVVTEYYEDGTKRSEKTFNNGTMDDKTVKSFPPANNNPLIASTAAVVATPPPPVDVPPTATIVDKEKEKVNLGEFNGEGQWKLYNKNKQLAKDGRFSKGRLMDGKVYFYDENGILKRIAQYKNGVYIGDTLEEQ